MTVLVDCDFQRDLRTLLVVKLSASNVTVDVNASTETLLWNWLKIQHRRIERRPRNVVWSAELRAREPSLTSDYRDALARIEAAIQAGEDLTPYLSRQLANDKAFTRNDGMLNELGMQHMHLGHGLNAQGMINGTKELLFVLFADDIARLVDIFDHEAFAALRPFEVAQANWPDLFARWQLPPRESREGFTAEERKTLRKKGMNTPLTARDGSTYLPPGGGSAASGISPRVVIASDQILERIGALERWCKDHGDELAAQIAATGRRGPATIRLRFAEFEESGVMIVFDDEHGIRFRLEP